MAKVVYSNGIDYISGALNKVKSNGQHSHEKMLLATQYTPIPKGILTTMTAIMIGNTMFMTFMDCCCFNCSSL